MSKGEIIIVPFPFSGHIFPATELATLLASRNYQITLLLPSLPSSPLHPLVRTVQCSAAPPAPPPIHAQQLPDPTDSGPHQDPPNGSSTNDILAELIDKRDSSSPPLLCVIVDVMISQLIQLCTERGVPAASLFTASACVAALENAAIRVKETEIDPDGSVIIPDLPEEMALSAFNLSNLGPPMQMPGLEGPGPISGTFPPTSMPPLPPPGHGLARGPHAPPPPPPGHGLAWGPHAPPPPPPGHGLARGPHAPPHPPPPGDDRALGPHAPPHPPPGHGPTWGPHAQPPLPPPHVFGGPNAPPQPPHNHHHDHDFRPPPPPFSHASVLPPPPPFFQTVGSQGPSGGPPGPPAMGLGQTDKAIALLFNTCNDLERPFLDYIAKEAKKPVLAVGPLLPSQFWSSVTGSISLIHDESVRPKHDSTHSERDVLNWLDSKPPHSVIYVSFGSTNTPSDAELIHLAAGLEQSNQAFIWSIQRSAMKHDPSGLPLHQDEPTLFDPDEFAKQVGDRGLVIRGWAPQLLILSHKSTGGFLTHCGWNSTVEALGCGMPMLTWPIHGDQIYNARLVTKWLKVGHVLKSEGQEAIKREQVLQGIQKLMADEEIRRRVKVLSRDVFGKGFPSSSADAVDAFLDLVDAKRRNSQE